MRKLATELTSETPQDGKFVFAAHIEYDGEHLVSQWFSHGAIEKEILIHVLAEALREMNKGPFRPFSVLMIRPQSFWQRFFRRG
jgi:hypothetical protein